MIRLNQWGHYDEVTGMMARLPTHYEREQHRRRVARDRVCQAIVIACALVLVAVIAGLR